MRPWRDVMAAVEWRKLVASLFKKAPRPIAEISRLLEAYHALEKTRLDRLEQRIALLGQVRTAALKYLKDFKIATKDDVTARQKLEPRFKETNFEGIVWVLSRRAGRKAAYLRQLLEYYRDERTPLCRPANLIHFLREPQHRHDDLLGLSRGVLMEKIDPWHRDYELEFREDTFHADGSLISYVFRDWFLDFNGGKTASPFFLWMEAHPVCTSQAKDRGVKVLYFPGNLESVVELGPKDVHGVYYSGEKIGLVTAVEGRLCEVLEDWTVIGHAPLPVCDTSGVTVSKSGPGFAAYVWTKNHELLICPHVPHRFHHSSFLGGEAVRCAGMIKVVAGKVHAISNNSGHYKPTVGHLKRLVGHLLSLHVLAPRAIVHLFTPAGSDTLSVDEFLTGPETLASSMGPFGKSL